MLAKSGTCFTEYHILIYNMYCMIEDWDWRTSLSVRYENLMILTQISSWLG
jgi:hypothetical protein